MKQSVHTAVLVLLLSSADISASQPKADVALNPTTFKTPNIVLMLADDMSWFDVGAYHQRRDDVPKNAITPNIDKVAQQGMMFTRAFTATAMCAVTRQQLYTGLYPVRNGAFGNHTRVYDEVKSVAHYFKALGYRVGLAGKGHVGPRPSFPFEKVGKENKGAAEVSTFGIEKARHFMARDKTQPFFLIVASANPHVPWNRGDTSQYPSASLELPVFFNDTPELRQQLSKYLAEVSDLDREVGLLDAELDALGIKDDTLFIFTTEQGSSLPFGKWTNYDSGLQTAFIVRWPEHIAPGARTDAMIEYVDVVPTLTDLVTGSAPPNLDGKSFKSVLQGKRNTHKKYAFGIQTSLNIHDGTPYPIRSIRSDNYKLIHNLMPNNEVTNIVTVDEWFKSELEVEKNQAGNNYARYIKRPEYEFYDLTNDPFEQVNLINQPQFKQDISALKKELSAWMRQQGDLGIETEFSVCERKAFSHRKCR